MKVKSKFREGMIVDVLNPETGKHESFGIIKNIKNQSHRGVKINGKGEVLRDIHGHPKDFTRRESNLRKLPKPVVLSIKGANHRSTHRREPGKKVEDLPKGLRGVVMKINASEFWKKYLNNRKN